MSMGFTIIFKKPTFEETYQYSAIEQRTNQSYFI